MANLIAKESASQEPSAEKAYTIYEIETMKDIGDKDVQIPVSRGSYTTSFIQNQIYALQYQIGEWQKKLDTINLLESK